MKVKMFVKGRRDVIERVSACLVSSSLGKLLMAARSCNSLVKAGNHPFEEKAVSSNGLCDDAGKGHAAEGRMRHYMMQE